MLDFYCDLLPQRAQPHTDVHPKRGEFSLTPTGRYQPLIPSHRIPSHRIPSTSTASLLPSPAFSRFMLGAACCAVSAAGSRGAAGGSSVAGVGARGRVSSRRLHLVSRRACEHKQVRELRQCPPTPCWTRCQQLALQGLARRSEQGGKCTRQNSAAWGNPPSFPSWEAATMNLSRV